ncbi:MAG: hypothetical protein HZB72_03480 [Burkholderiales bacterium]|nr:hypothetical protein [Burkholderiales bacterium]
MSPSTRPARAGLPAWLWAAGYFALVAALQQAASSTAELDQAEQLVLSQSLAWGYTNQPPLYTALVWAVFQLTGPSLAALSAIKVGLLTALVAGCDRIGLALGLDAPRRRVALWGLMLLPPVVWEAQRDLTHSLLAAALAALLCAQVLGLLRRGQGGQGGEAGLAAYALAGLLAGLTVLAKHNAAVLALALAAALLLTPAWRARLRPAGVALAVSVAALVVLPHGLWLMAHADALQHTLDKVARGEARGPLQQAVALAGGLLQGGLGFAGTLLLAAPLLGWRRRSGAAPMGRTPAMAAPAEARDDTGGGRPGSVDPLTASAPALLGRLLACAVLLLVALAVAMQAHSFKSRWFLPVLFLLPLWLAARCTPPRGWRGRAFTGWAVFVAAACAVFLPAHVWHAVPGQPVVRRNEPLVAAGQALARVVPGQPVAVLAPHHLLAGNLRLAWPQAQVRAASLTPAGSMPPLAGRVLVVCPPSATGTAGWSDWLQRQTGRSSDQITWQGLVEVPMLHRPQMPAYRLLWAVVDVPPRAGAAR